MRPKAGRENWEGMRTAMSLARQRCDKGRRREAGDLLAPVYNWFTEDFEMSDLKNAKALLNDLT
jgi:predicted ATPase